MGVSQSHEDSIHPQDSKSNIENNRVKLKNSESNISVRPTKKKTSFVYSISSKKPEKTQGPYNYETILRDVDSPIDTSTMYKLISQLHYGVFLNQNRKKYWVDKNNKNCFMLFARDLSIAWAETSRHWHWFYQKEISTRSLLVRTVRKIPSIKAITFNIIRSCFHCHDKRSSFWMGNCNKFGIKTSQWTKNRTQRDIDEQAKGDMD
ncbi:hypothetical protein J1N35_033102 [Gossypium stocksii]|uniref:Uncharacterized protein n=1 Tax=Gossypium stocksii TaxID=47602 RepID=A0A9D3UPH4_9ROSI|nr:hypothetical protein J1N35_033102 [Gossypium stocksii]